MEKWQKLVLGGALIMAIAAGALIYNLLSSSVQGGVEVTWDMLGQLDYISGNASPELKAQDGQKVKIPGFMVPLEDSSKSVSEFLLVPSPQACIHVPPPPPNQMVYIQMKRGTEIAFGPIWVYGTLHLTSKKHMYGESSFELDGEMVEPYR